MRHLKSFRIFESNSNQVTLKAKKSTQGWQITTDEGLFSCSGFSVGQLKEGDLIYSKNKQFTKSEPKIDKIDSVKKYVISSIKNETKGDIVITAEVTELG